MYAGEAQGLLRLDTVHSLEMEIAIASERSDGEKLPLSWLDGAEDGIEPATLTLARWCFSSLWSPTSLSCCSVEPVSTSSTQSVALVERST